MQCRTERTHITRTAAWAPVLIYLLRLPPTLLAQSFPSIVYSPLVFGRQFLFGLRVLVLYFSSITSVFQMCLVPYITLCLTEPIHTLTTY